MIMMGSKVMNIEFKHFDNNRIGLVCSEDHMYEILACLEVNLNHNDPDSQQICREVVKQLDKLDEAR